ncbi:hypothetical protein GGI02_004128 [Coemansia sp. RSA 2322]|nr:hypothetical protein GGI02_004128 [Coemansia sp. RSA 2322]
MDGGSFVDYYAVLRVPHTATHAEIKRAYHALSLKVHPDKQVGAMAGAGHAAELEFHQLSLAWEVLGSSERRREHDRMLSAARNRSRGVVQDEVDLDDMDLDEMTAIYSYPCRCSGRYSIGENDLDAGREIAPCSDCSLKIRVLYEVAAACDAA